MNYTFLLNISVCFLLSLLVGIERQYRRRIVGLRTIILVSIGSFLFVTFSFQVGSSDISRIASQVVTGIGFLGAGAILKDGKKVRGLTTAATLWGVAAIGVLAAGGALFEAIVGTFIILFSNIVLRYINDLVNNISGNKDTIYEFNLIVGGNSKILEKIKKDIQEFVDSHYIVIQDRKYVNDFPNNSLCYRFIIQKNDYQKIEELQEKIIGYKPKSFELVKLSEARIDEFED